MDNYPRAFIKAGLVYVVLGSLLGIAMVVGVAWTKANWPDLRVGVIISGLIFKSSVEIIKEAWMDIKGGDPLSLT